MAFLSGGHAATDLSQGAIAALLVFLRPELGLSYTELTAVVLVATISSSIVQPLFGMWSDNRGTAWLLPVGVAVSGIGIALASVAPSYPLLLLCVAASGIGVAAYHPEASKFARYVSGTRRAGGMSWFSIGGNVGFALGPLVASTIVLTLGLRGGLLLAVPPVIVAVLLVFVTPYLMQFAPEKATTTSGSGERDRPRALVLLLTIVSFGSRLLFLFLLAGAVGTLIGGPLADRIGTRLVTGASHALSVPLILIYALVGGVAGAIAVILAGGLIIATFAVTLVMSQEYMPNRVGLASGLSIGFSIGLGGVAAVTLGVIADGVGIKTAVLATLFGPAVAAILTLFLPATAEKKAMLPAAVGVPA
jgi:FSR family fosmidomycin resistance protein-like MFS transporter